MVAVVFVEVKVPHWGDVLCIQRKDAERMRTESPGHHPLLINQIAKELVISQGELSPAVRNRCEHYTRWTLKLRPVVNKIFVTGRRKELWR